MKELFEIYDGSAEAKKAKGKSKNLSGFHPLFTASARRSIALDALKIWLLLGVHCGRGDRCCNRCRSSVGPFGASDRRSNLFWLPG